MLRVEFERHLQTLEDDKREHAEEAKRLLAREKDLLAFEKTMRDSWLITRQIPWGLLSVGRPQAKGADLAHGSLFVAVQDDAQK
jgi:hypothetical protein